ncbi:ester cyclase [Tsukamurella ocularis]|uniref:ester cyclase n=1 Tax=Tsukamurella ocularis TaxID=1970234 RepID=UPI00216713B3|nr:ester cyclase [Tsukamurella ocularis]MCS3779335.1 hypothetical protein [Tsukamurella ocularis]MCS3789939.1 hypothetical protein [Tsukamurella ocularis]MCS3852436.1 hypothetical protein [Tsukamurella ocularis]
MTDIGFETTIWRHWTALWNGEIDQADPESFIADETRVHLPKFGMPPEHTLATRSSVVNWINGFRSFYAPDARFAAELGPWLIDEYVIARWKFTGTWISGAPAGALAASGTAVAISGVDILRIDNSKRIAEYWLTDDQLDLYSQLAAPVPVGQRNEV